MVPPAGASCRYRSPSSCTMVSIRFGSWGGIDRLATRSTDSPEGSERVCLRRRRLGLWVLGAFVVLVVLGAVFGEDEESEPESTAPTTTTEPGT